MDRDEYLDKVFAGILDMLVPPESLKPLEDRREGPDGTSRRNLRMKNEDDSDDQPDLHDLFV